PVLSQVSGGSLPATTYYVKIAYVISGALGPGSPERSLAVAANNLLQVSSPVSVAGATSYKVYGGTPSEQGTLQAQVTLGTACTERTTGLIIGAAPSLQPLGDGNQTKATHLPAGNPSDTNNRVTQMVYDTRDRLVATKSGVQATEDTTTHRPILFYTLDNLGETTQVDQYDGDGGTVSTTPPSSTLLRARTATSYDDQGRVYLTQPYSVNSSTGAVFATALSTNTWYNHRGQVIKTSQPGGLVTKNAYDGAGRTTTSYTTDGGGDASWTDAGNVTGDNVLTQVESS